MRGKSLFLFLCVILIGCKSKIDDKSKNHPVDSLIVTAIKDSTNLISASTKDSPIDTSIIAPEDIWTVADMEPLLRKIDKATYDKCKRDYKTKCILDAKGFIQGKGLSFESHCDAICEEFLVEAKTKRKMLLPADFDAGLMGLQVSPSCKQFITYSSYDMPDYDQYYTHRALLMCYEVRDGMGLNIIKHQKTYGLKQWSIAEVVWSNEQCVVLKLYSGSNAGRVNYKYFKALLKRD